MTGVRKAGVDDVSRLGHTLGRAFEDDPAFAWAAPNRQRRQRLGSRFFERVIARTYLPKGEVHTVDDGIAAAVWAPPSKWQTSPLEVLPLIPLILRVSGRNVGVALQMLTLMERRHKELAEPHYYLAYIGTDPDHRGKGHGNALLDAMTSRCDEEGVPAYLESTSMRNQALYHRHGFKVLDEMKWPKGGPPWWPMWREPRTG